MEDNIILEEQFSNTNLHPTFPAAAQEKQEYNEGIIEFKNTQMNANKALAKTSHTDDNVVIKNTIQGGERSVITEDVRPYFSILDYIIIDFISNISTFTLNVDVLMILLLVFTSLSTLYT